MAFSLPLGGMSPFFDDKHLLFGCFVLGLRTPLGKWVGGMRDTGSQQEINAPSHLPTAAQWRATTLGATAAVEDGIGKICVMVTAFWYRQIE